MHLNEYIQKLLATLSSLYRMVEINKEYCLQSILPDVFKIVVYIVLLFITVERLTKSAQSKQHSTLLKKTGLMYTKYVHLFILWYVAISITVQD